MLSSAIAGALASPDFRNQALRPVESPADSVTDGCCEPPVECARRNVGRRLPGARGLHQIIRIQVRRATDNYCRQRSAFAMLP